MATAPESHSKTSLMPSSGQKPALLFIIVTVLLDSIGFGIILPVMPTLVMSLTGEGISGASSYAGWLLFSYAIMQFIFSPILGNLSDRFGRRPVLLASVAMLAVDYLVMGFATSITWLFVGRILSGIAAATFATANAFVADVSSAQKRAQNYGMIGAAFGVGFIIGPVLGGLLGEYGERVPFFAAAVLSVLNLFYGVFFLRESLSQVDRRPFNWRKANAFSALLSLKKYPMLSGLAAAFFVYHLAHWVLPSTWSYFTMERLSWSEREVGFSLGAVGVCMVIVQGGLIRVAVAKWGERTVGIIGFSAMICGFLGFAFASSTQGLYFFLVPFALSGFITPAFQGIMTNQVPADSQGELQGALNSLMSITAVFGPLLMTQTFSFFTSEAAPIYFPGASFILASGLVCISLLVFLWSTRKGSGCSLK